MLVEECAGWLISLCVVMKEMHYAMKSDSSKWIVLSSAAFVLWRGSVFARAQALGCGEAFVCCVLCVRALRWGICLKGLVVARLTCLCLTLFCAVGQFWVCGILVRGVLLGNCSG